MSAHVAAPVMGPAVAARVRSLDAVRGAGVALMILDHAVLVLAGPELLRHTVTRAALPLFLLVAGYLARRCSWRLLWVAGVGLALPFAVPWIDSPNILLWIVVGVVVVVVARSRGLLVPVLVAAVTVLLNGYFEVPGAYPLAGVLALMCVGAMLPAGWSSWAEGWPRWLVVLGRYPLSVYVGHLLVLRGWQLVAA